MFFLTNSCMFPKIILPLHSNFKIGNIQEMSKLIKPKGYRALLDLVQTEQGIKLIKEFFQQNLSTELRLRRVTAPLFVLQGLGINDDLNGVERAVTFPIKELNDAKAEVVHSLAKWKRMKLAEDNIPPGYGIYTDMNAIRADEELDNLHSLYVDQWDWEAVIREEDRTQKSLREIVERIYGAIRRTEYLACEWYPQLKPFLPEKIFFIHAEELLQMYPDMTPKEREHAICKQHGAVFIIGIGGRLSNGEKHDGRAPDYDDWSTIAENGTVGLNGDSDSVSLCTLETAAGRLGGMVSAVTSQLLFIPSPIKGPAPRGVLPPWTPHAASGGVPPEIPPLGGFPPIPPKGRVRTVLG